MTRLRDTVGGIWERDDIGQQWITTNDSPPRVWVKAYRDWADFLEGYGPLSDATQETTHG